MTNQSKEQSTPTLTIFTEQLQGILDYPDDACPRYLQAKAKFDDVQVTNDVTASEVTASGITLTSRKSFDIPHPVKKGYRLRHVCLEGPEAGVYYRGRITNSNVIELPEYWRGLVDPETISVSLTQIKTSQDLIVEEIEWAQESKSNQVMEQVLIVTILFMQSARMVRLIVEYEGEDYPGDDSQYSLNR